MLDHRAPLEQCSRVHDQDAIDRPDLRVVPVRGRGLLLLQGEPGEGPLQDALLGQVDLQLPAPQTARTQGAYALLWMAPKEWLLELPADDTFTLQAALASQLVPALAAVTNISDSLASFDVSGERAAEVLMTSCGIDLRPQAFAASRVVRTVMADMPAIIWKAANLHPFRCLVDRSFAAHFWNWLARSPGAW
jgi:heterotetrameric sarcosine oxidase gamma subunit